jgi:hypothetical protein
MNHRTKVLLFLLLLPLGASAHGEEVLLTAFLLLGSLVLFLVVILVISVPYAEKAILVSVYLVTIGLALFWTNDLPYRPHMTLINLVIGLAPVGTTVGTYFVVRARRKERTGK